MTLGATLTCNFNFIQFTIPAWWRNKRNKVGAHLCHLIWGHVVMHDDRFSKSTQLWHIDSLYNVTTWWLHEVINKILTWLEFNHVTINNREEIKQHLKCVFLWFSNNNGDCSGKHINFVAIHCSSFFWIRRYVGKSSWISHMLIVVDTSCDLLLHVCDWWYCNTYIVYVFYGIFLVQARNIQNSKKQRIHVQTLCFLV
jgi:hypothetical protein